MEKDEYIKKIIELLNNVKDERFLRQIWTIVKKHIEKGEGS